MEALEMLDEAGYTNLVGLKGCVRGGVRSLPLHAGKQRSEPVPLDRMHPSLLATHPPAHPPRHPPARSGFYSWFRVFDNKGNRRRGDGYTETYTHDGEPPPPARLPSRLPPVLRPRPARRCLAPREGFRVGSRGVPQARTKCWSDTSSGARCAAVALPPSPPRTGARRRGGRQPSCVRCSGSACACSLPERGAPMLHAPLGR